MGQSDGVLMPSDAIMVDGWGGDESNDCPEDGISPVTPQEGGSAALVVSKV
jgi:hypothetical protein